MVTLVLTGLASAVNAVFIAPTRRQSPTKLKFSSCPSVLPPMPPYTMLRSCCGGDTEKNQTHATLVNIVFWGKGGEIVAQAN